MGKKRNLYAVAVDHELGTHESKRERKVKKFNGVLFKTFQSKVEAEDYMKEKSSKGVSTGTSKHLMTNPAAKTKSKGLQVAHANAPVPSCAGNPLKSFAIQDFSVLETASVDNEFLADPGTKDSKQEPSRKQLPTHLNADLDSVTDPSILYQLEYDGASKGNPGLAGAGAVIRHPDRSVVCEISVGLGMATYKVAEYRGLIAGMRKALDLGIERLQVQGDSKVVIMQIRGKWKIQRLKLAVLRQEAIHLIKNFKEFQICLVDSEYNCAADALANKGVGLPEGEFLSSFPNAN